MPYVPATTDVKRLLNGESLRVVLYPDESLGDYTEPAVECFQLPNIVVKGKRFWGTSHGGVPSDDRPHSTDSKIDYRMPGSYAYNNFADLVINSSFLSGMIRIYKASKYSEIQFVTVKDFRLLWDSKSKKNPALLDGKIKKGKGLKIAFFDDQGIWNIHPIDLAAYFKKSKMFRLDTQKFGYPEMVRDPEFVSGLAAKFAQIEQHTASIDNMAFHLARYRFWSNGTYAAQVGDVLVAKKYRHLKVFCEM